MKYLNRENFFDLLEFIGVAILVSVSFFLFLDTAWFHPDESMWINKSHNFEYFFSGRFDEIEKQPAGIGYSMPILPEFVIGFGRRLGGYQPSDLNAMWDWNKTYEENQDAGSIPPSDLIWWARFMPASLSVISIIVTFYLVKAMFGKRVSYIWILLAVTDEWLVNSLQRAMGESPLLFCITLAWLVGFFAMRSFNKDKPLQLKTMILLTVFGLLTGLAGQAKHNGLSVYGFGIAVVLYLSFKCDSISRWRFAFIAIFLMSLATFVFFIGINPFLWNDPVGSMQETFRFRMKLMHDIQAQAFPEYVIHNWREGLWAALSQIFGNLTPMKFPNAPVVKALLALIGLVVFIIQTWEIHFFSTADLAGPLSLAGMSFFVGLPNLFTPLNFDRYYMLPAYFVLIAIAVGISWFIFYFLNGQGNNWQQRNEARL